MLFCSGLDSNGNWSFRLSRNESLHSYPSTFVHAIPASFINALGLKGELILDPFGGTGQTAVEAIKYGGKAISSDSNFIATMITKTRLTYIHKDLRQEMRDITIDDILEFIPTEQPNFELINKWHHKNTIEELCRILSFIVGQKDNTSKQFFRTCFSAILPLTTGRRGKQHGHFADNTPLAKEQDAPPYQKAIDLFIQRININLDILERFYSFLERNDLSPSIELERAKVLQLDVLNAIPEAYGINKNSVAVIITSPPYLCMADYTLGLRLSYYWLEPSLLEEDYKMEIGARRQRTNPKDALENYLNNMEKFALNASKLLRQGGFLAIVLSKPTAKAFQHIDIINEIDSILLERGLKIIWEKWRPISWHRNYGFQRVREERLSVYLFE